MTVHTKDRLAQALREIGLDKMASDAEAGRYDDFLSNSATPQMDLVARLGIATGRGNLAAAALARRVMNGEFDGTLEESEAWAASPEGQAAFAELAKGGKS
jgi:hypothetical protein